MARGLLRLSDYGISPTRGFLSAEPPLTSFPDPYYAEWDALLADLPELISSRALKRRVSALPALSTAKLSSDLERQRAYVALGFLIHAHVWGSFADGEEPADTVPPQLSEPFLSVCAELDIPPVLLYAGLCLWNWRADHPAAAGEGEDAPFDLGRLRTLGSFTGTSDEDAFYLVPVLVEADGAHLVPEFLEAIEAAGRGDAEFVAGVLARAGETLAALNKHLRKFYSTLDADTFYHRIRPFLPGGKGMEGQGLPRGMVFQRSDGTELAAKFGGGSAAQTSLFQFLDHVLGVEHASSITEVFKEMRSLMPAKHRQFLDDVSELPTLRAFVLDNRDNRALEGAFNECLKQLRSWRGQHMAVVSKYIVQPSRASAEKDGAEGGALQGTAGSDLIPFLQQSRVDSVGVDGKAQRSGGKL
ncbi:related to tryptophan 2,3 dioxygenase [Cephalotrichum gorgonifer]|uniref:Related to tryptophan 2,3 dioxygenase n=1 Tax=Cephalotrichum gorgonifer TaxID=2041049 RepID=A0AAE8N8D7_9PEZI|nr:related to tryptophan 2,3 dioxygenase [Cephalotrichum gorgonifer]